MAMEKTEIEHESYDDEMDNDESSDGYIKSEIKEENESDGDDVNIQEEKNDAMGVIDEEDGVSDELEGVSDEADNVSDEAEGVSDEPDHVLDGDQGVSDANKGVGDEEQNVESKDENNEIKKKKKRKNSSKLPPQRQKRVIHTLLKKAKIYEIRKLTRRINVLKASKGTEELQAKKLRKAERFIKEIEAIREFMIDKLTDRTVDAFKGRSEELYNKMWESCYDPIKTNDMLQVLSNKEGENFTDIAYFRMLSSKDIVGKFQRIAIGENLSAKPEEQNDKKAEDKGLKTSTKKGMNTDKKRLLSRKTTAERSVEGEKVDIDNTKAKKNDKKRRSNKKDKDSVVGGEEIEVDKENTVDIREQVKFNKSTQNEEKKEKVKTKDKKIKNDDFFMGDSVQVTDDESSAESENEEEEFTAPVKRDIQLPDIKKKNRMGQRDRKRFQDIKHKRVDPRQQPFRGRGRGRGVGERGARGGRGFGERGARGRRGFGERGARGGRDFGERGARGGRGRDYSNLNRTFNNEDRFERTSKPKSSVVKSVDESLHPSWQAKQKQKSQQGIADFAGTKITFDD